MKKERGNDLETEREWEGGRKTEGTVRGEGVGAHWSTGVGSLPERLELGRKLELRRVLREPCSVI